MSGNKKLIADQVESSTFKYMAKQIIKIERQKLLENIKKGEFHMRKTKVLSEDLNTQILLAMEIRAASRKPPSTKEY